MKRSLRFLILSAAVMAVSVACKQKQEEEKVEQLPLVAVESAVMELVDDEEAYSSLVQPWAKNNIAPQSAGRIEQLLVEIGDFVSAGQMVARMDDIQLQQAELQVTNDKVEYDRMKSLHEKGGLSQSDFDSFELSCKVHKNNYENLLKNTVLRSPISGVISARNYDRGDMYTMGQPIYTVEQVTPVKMLVGISETDYTRVKVGDPASITTDAFPGKVFKGSITNIYPTIDSRTHTFNAEVKVANADRKLRPGMYAKVTVTFGRGRCVLVPDRAVVKQTGSGDRFVYYLNPDNTVTYKLVKVGRRLNDRYIILDGVKEGDKVVTEGLLRIKDGVSVKVR